MPLNQGMVNYSSLSAERQGILRQLVDVPPADANGDDAAMQACEAAMWALCDVDGRIKAVLTGLLNREEVRSNERARPWVMERLMEVEREMRRLRGRMRHAGDGRRGGAVRGGGAERRAG
jgi:hypothetical protein